MTDQPTTADRLTASTNTAIVALAQLAQDAKARKDDVKRQRRQLDKQRVAVVVGAQVATRRINRQDAALAEEQEELKQVLSIGSPQSAPPAPAPSPSDGLPAEISVKGFNFRKTAHESSTFYVPDQMIEPQNVTEWPNFELAGKKFSPCVIDIANSIKTVAYFVDPLVPGTSNGLPHGATLIDRSQPSTPSVPNSSVSKGRAKWPVLAFIIGGMVAIIVAFLSLLTGPQSGPNVPQWLVTTMWVFIWSGTAFFVTGGLVAYFENRHEVKIAAEAEANATHVAS